MYEPSHHLATYFITGFQHWNRALALDQLKPGQRLRMEPESDNPYDPNAIALYAQGVKLGYIPASENDLVSPMCFYGHAGALEMCILQIDPQFAPWKQVRVGCTSSTHARDHYAS